MLILDEFAINLKLISSKYVNEQSYYSFVNWAVVVVAYHASPGSYFSTGVHLVWLWTAIAGGKFSAKSDRFCPWDPKISLQYRKVFYSSLWVLNKRLGAEKFRLIDQIIHFGNSTHCIAALGSWNFSLINGTYTCISFGQQIACMQDIQLSRIILIQQDVFTYKANQFKRGWLQQLLQVMKLNPLSLIDLKRQQERCHSVSTRLTTAWILCHAIPNDQVSFLRRSSDVLKVQSLWLNGIKYAFLMLQQSIAVISYSTSDLIWHEARMKREKILHDD